MALLVLYQVLEFQRWRASPCGSATVKEERDRAGTSSSHLEENVAERCAVVGGPKRKEVEQLKILRAELKYVL